MDAQALAPPASPRNDPPRGRVTTDWHLAVFAIVCLVCVTLVEYRGLVFIHASNFPAHVDAATQILLGHPTWKAYQNRLMGPEIVRGLAFFSGESYADCYRSFCFAALFLGNSICFCLFYRHRKSADLAAVYTILYAALFVAFQDPRWLYLWDFIDLSVMLLFAWAVVMGKSKLWPLAALFFVELFNRESAVFIAMWMIIDAVQYDAGANAKPRLRINYIWLATGTVLGIAGTLWTSYIRDRLCFQISGLQSWNGLQETAHGQLFILPITLKLFADNSAQTIALLVIILGAAAYFLIRAWTPLAGRAWKILLLLSALTAANFCFAYIFELRVWLTFLPLILCLAYLRKNHDRQRLDQTSLDNLTTPRRSDLHDSCQKVGG